MAQTDGAHAEARNVGRALAALLADEPALAALLPDGYVERAAAYAGLLLEANRRLNLTRVTAPAEVARLHLLDALAALPHLDDVAPGDGDRPRLGWGRAGHPAGARSTRGPLGPGRFGAQEGGGAARDGPGARPVQCGGRGRTSGGPRSCRGAPRAATTWSRRGPARPCRCWPSWRCRCSPSAARCWPGRDRWPPATKSWSAGRLPSTSWAAGRRRWSRPVLPHWAATPSCRAQGAPHAGALPAAPGRAQPSAARVGG